MKIVKFSAPWCGQCRALSEALKNTPFVISMEEINVDDDNKNLSEVFNVMSLPTIILIDDMNKELKRWTGLTDINIINNYINNIK